MTDLRRWASAWSFLNPANTLTYICQFVRKADALTLGCQLSSAELKVHHISIWWFASLAQTGIHQHSFRPSLKSQINDTWNCFGHDDVPHPAVPAPRLSRCVSHSTYKHICIITESRWGCPEHWMFYRPCCRTDPHGKTMPQGRRTVGFSPGGNPAKRLLCRALCSPLSALSAASRF